ncbi:MAG TPA: NUDIX domain-containing protein [Kiritimatiellia bacterium]|nr:NUDIX domain-containing protein [Kiritimatiellia bacterium]
MTDKPYGLAVKAVLTDEQGRCLLIRRSPHNRSFVGQWEWPGGKVDPGEDFAEAAVREAKEESGLDVELTGLLGATSFEVPKLHIVLVCFDARVTGGELRLSDEHDAAEWVPWSRVAEFPLAESVRDFMLEQARRRAGAA